MDEFADQLESLSVPAWNAPSEEWESYAGSLRQLIDNFRDLTGINYLQQPLPEEDKARLTAIVWNEASTEAYIAYLKGTALLVDCLALAMVGNRKEIEARLLLPAVKKPDFFGKV